MAKVKNKQVNKKHKTVKQKQPKKSKTRSIKTTQRNLQEKLKNSKGNVAQYEIPENKFKKALELLDKGRFKQNYEEYRCLAPVHDRNSRSRDLLKINMNASMAQARLCLLKRDWINLAKIISTVKIATEFDKKYFSSPLLKYATICLAYSEDEFLMEQFLTQVLDCSTEDERAVFWANMTTFKKNNEI